MNLWRRNSSDDTSRENIWLPSLLWVLFLLYWLFARSLERVDMSPMVSDWQAIIPFLPFPGAIAFVIEMIHPTVSRHLVVVIAGWLLAKSAAVNLVHTLYDLPDRDFATVFLNRLRSTKHPLGKPLAVSGKTLKEDRLKSVLLRVGGPGLVVIEDREVAVTEINGCYHRVLGPGLRKLSRLEYIYAVLDLRQQERHADDVTLITKDGIEIKFSITVTYQIHTGGNPPSERTPYPYDKDAVRLAAYAETVLTDNGVSTWDSIPLGLARGMLGRIIAKYHLDQLLYPSSSASDPNLTIKNELVRRVRPVLENYGIELTNLYVGPPELPEKVRDQYVKYWQTHWETQVQLQEVDGEAFRLEEIEVARAEAEVTMIQAIAEGLDRARPDGGTDAVKEAVALRLIEALERVAEQSQVAYPLPPDLLPQLGDLRQRLSTGKR